MVIEHRLHKGCVTMLWLFTYVILLVVFCSVVHFIFQKQWKSTRKLGIAYEVFYALILIYMTVILGFGLLYFMFSFHDIILLEQSQERVMSPMMKWWQSIYFSGVTMLTIGYGDIAPLGVGRFFALIQALIGFVLPTAFVLKVVHLNYEEKEQKS